MRFFLNFKSDNYGKKQINEPFGVDGIDFSLNQKDGLMGRDISFSGGSIMFEFTNKRDHQLQQLLYYNRIFGFESKVILTIEIDENNSYDCELDFANAETDDLEYFKCKGIEDGNLQILKRRKGVKVNVLSDKDIDGNYITPLVAENMLIKAKPVIQSSTWKQFDEFYDKTTATVTIDSTIYKQINPSNLVTYGLEDSYQFFEPVVGSPISLNSSSFQSIKAKDNLKKVVVLFDKIKFDFTTDVDNGGNGYVDLRLLVKHGTTFDTATTKELLFVNKTENQSYSFEGSFSYEIERLDRGDSIWIYYDVKVRQSASQIIVKPRFEFFFNSRVFNTKITAQSISYNSIAKSLRLVDVMAQVVKSISGLSINAPRFKELGEFYDNRLVNGKFLRGLGDTMLISLEDIEKSITEFRGDWEIGSDEKVFFGIEKDFYTNNEIAFFDNIQFSEMNKTFNPKYMINEFMFNYDKFQALKENEELNSADNIHGESTFTFFNKNVENKKEVKIQWIRDAFLIESTRRKAIEITEETASQDDDDIFCIDTVNTTFVNEFIEVTSLQHSYDPSTDKLILRNDGSINFVSLGIAENSLFYILPTDANAGTYRVFSVEFAQVTLTRVLGLNSSLGDGIRSTKYKYTLDPSFIPFTNYTDLGFTETSGLNAPESYSNRRYSNKTNINNYYNSYLATANLYRKDKELVNTWYKNNGEYTAKYNGITLKENANFIPNNPILSPVLYNDMVFSDVDFEYFVALSSRVRSQRGYIRTIDNNQQVVRIYPIDISFSILSKELSIKAEEKYQPTRMTISTQFDYVLINNETRVSSLIYEFENDRLTIFDENRFRLYNSVYWQEVSINGAIPSNLAELKNWMSLVN